jgi:hypothetical protein
MTDTPHGTPDRPFDGPAINLLIDRVRVRRGEDGQLRVGLVADNNELVFWSEGYTDDTYARSLAVRVSYQLGLYGDVDDESEPFGDG